MSSSAARYFPEMKVKPMNRGYCQDARVIVASEHTGHPDSAKRTRGSTAPTAPFIQASGCHEAIQSQMCSAFSRLSGLLATRNFSSLLLNQTLEWQTLSGNLPKDSIYPRANNFKPMFEQENYPGFQGMYVHKGNNWQNSCLALWNGWLSPGPSPR